MGAWIEIIIIYCIRSSCQVAPFMGAWIEIILRSSSPGDPKVAPFMGAWIEIRCNTDIYALGNVAPFMGAWIEIFALAATGRHIVSHPLWVRGLKSKDVSSGIVQDTSSHPLWVRGLKLLGAIHVTDSRRGRTLYGCVD